VGKTSVATGLMAALRRRGTEVASAKVGPDYIDPGYHSLATGRVGRNLDSFLCGPDAIAPLAATAGEGADLLVVEGVMGLFDGVGATIEGSTAAVAALLDAPVVLVVDAASMSRSVAAVVHGYDDHLLDATGRRIGGLVLNRVGSDTHDSILREALAPLGIPVLGSLRRDPRLTWRDRHLGLVPVVESHPAVNEALDHLRSAVAESLDLSAIERLARSAPARFVGRLPAARQVTSSRPVVAVASGPAFGFSYPDNLERLQEAGAELAFFDPMSARELPDGSRALYACGGFPEVFATALAENRPLLNDVRRRAVGGLPCWAECGGLLWLSRRLDGRELCGVIPATATMGDRVTVGYRHATVRTDNPVAGAGQILVGHEHHYSTVDPAGDALALRGRVGATVAGWASPTVLASYLHLHLGSDPAPAERFVARAAQWPEEPGGGG
jgi:cobyrinic acid a,c-diamide synthase